MTQNELQKTLAELRSELAQLSPKDETTKAHIHQLVASLEQHLNEPEDANRNTLRESVSSAVEKFEAEHPRITLLLNQIMNTLSGSGI
jgi:cell division protein FtsB